MTNRCWEDEMIYTPMINAAMRIAYDAHHGQCDKCGVPYIYHPVHLAEQMTDEISVCAALMHDVAEDTSVTFEALAAQGISESVIEVLKLLTHEETVPYMDYVRNIKASGNQTAIKIKLADLRHNSDVSRGIALDDKMRARLEKYKAAIELLEA
jgi:(p)ppGpp synthase/HD superfamily hydrolase